MSITTEKHAELWFICDCGWSGTLDDLDAGLSEMGCCPQCGNEDFDGEP